MSISFVQKKYAAASGNVTLDSTPTEGNLLIAFVTRGGATGAPSDDQGAFTQVDADQSDGVDTVVAIYYRVVAAGTGTGITSANTTIGVIEVTGQASSGLVHTSNKNTFSGTTPSLALTLTEECCVVFGWGDHAGTSAQTEGSGYTVIGSTTGNNSGSEYKVDEAAGSITPGVTLGASATGAMIAAAFKADAGVLVTGAGSTTLSLTGTVAGRVIGAGGRVHPGGWSFAPAQGL